MSDAAQTYQRVEAYLNNELSAMDQQLFMEQMAQDPALAKQVKTHQLANELVQKNRRLVLKDLIAQEDQKARQSSLQQRIGIGLLILTALVTVTYFVIQSAQTVESDPIPPTKPQVPKTSAAIYSSREPEQAPPKKQQPTEKNTVYATSPVGGKLEIEPSKPLAVKAITSSTQMLLPPKEHSPPVPAKPVQDHKESKIEPCKQVDISAEISTSETCKGHQTGEIHVTKLTGGTAPYLYTISESSLQQTTHLAAGRYQLTITDALGCQKIISDIVIKAVDCTEEFSLNPFIGDTWAIPLQSTSGTLTVFDDRGNVYFRMEILGGTQQYWDGKSLNGVLKVGYYPFIIASHEGDITKGSISIGE